MSKRWTYKVVEVKAGWMGLKAPQVEATLAPLGSLGWELVSVTQVAMTMFLYLKKEA